MMNLSITIYCREDKHDWLRKLPEVIMDHKQALDTLRGIFSILWLAYHDPDWRALLSDSLADDRGIQRINRLNDAIAHLDTQKERCQT